MRCKVLVLLLLTCVNRSWADEFRPLYRSARAQAMGNAFVALADNEDAIFYNPAGLAGVKKISLNLLSLDVDGSNDLLTNFETFKSSLSNLGISTISQLVGKNIYVRGTDTASIVAPGFGIAGIFDEQVAIRLKNSASPQGLIGMQGTYGGQFGTGFRLLKLKKKKGELRMGIGGKLLWRTGGYNRLNLTQLLTLNTAAITGGMSNYGIGYGVDAGLQFIYRFKKKFTVQLGTAMTDIGDTSFATGAAAQQNNFSVGLAGTYGGPDVSVTLAYEYAHILQYADSLKKNHVGLELKFPFLSLYGGLNQVYPTYGIGLDLWVFKLMALSYAEEQATLVNQDPERRMMVHLGVKFEL